MPNRIEEAKLLMDSVALDGAQDNGALQLDSVAEMGDKMKSFNANTGVETIRKTVLDSVAVYEKHHGTKPSADLVACALDQAKIMLDDAVNGTSSAHNPTAFTPMQPMIAIRAMLASAIPFAHYIQTDKTTGEAPLIIVSHNAGKGTGSYAEGASLNGLGGGEQYVMPERSHRLNSTDKTTFTGKITPVMEGFEQCKQDATPHPLYKGRTQIYINGLRVATTQRGSDVESAAGLFAFGSERISFTATVNVNTGESTVTFAKAVPDNTRVSVRGFLNFETGDRAAITPSVIVSAEKYVMHASNYRANVVVTPEAAVQFSREIGVDPAFEGTMAIRQQFGLEQLYSTLQKLSIIGQFTQKNTFDFNWKAQGLEKTQAEIAVELIGLIAKESQIMANRNTSHGISHIYVGDTMRAVFLSLGADFFEPSGIAERPGAYRLGRLAGRYEIYYTPKGIIPEIGEKPLGDRMLLIGANAANPAFNPVIMGEAAAPNIESIAPNAQSPDKGYWVTGKNFNEQNPVNLFAQSVAVIDVLGTAY